MATRVAEVPPPEDPLARLRREANGRLSMLRAPGANARLARAARRPMRLRGLRAGAPEPVDVDAGAVLLKAARHTARWLGLEPEVFHTATGLAWDGAVPPALDSAEWTRCLALVRLGGRLEAKLGRRGVVRAWLTVQNLQLRPTPLAVLARPDGLSSLNAYLDAYER